MSPVIDVAAADGPVSALTETGGAGLLGDGYLRERPLGEYVGEAEQPRFVLRNTRGGLTVAGDGGETTLSPGGDYSALALVTDVRVLFAVGQAGGDETRSVPLRELVEADTADAFLGGALVLSTQDGRTLEFPCRGDVGRVAEFLERARAVWSRAERRLERAETALADARAAFDDGDYGAALAAIDEGRAAAASARETAADLAGVAATVADRADTLASALASFERRSHVQRAEAAREECRALREEGAFERADERLRTAAEGYAAALSVDADTPPDEHIEEHRTRLAAERDRLRTAPLSSGQAALSVARDTEDPRTRLTWLERAREAFLALLSLNWAAEDPRFAGSTDEARDRLETVASLLVAAHRDLVEHHVERATAAAAEDPAAARRALQDAEAALADGRECARELAPDERELLDEAAETLAERRAALTPLAGGSGGPDDGAETGEAPAAGSVAAEAGDAEAEEAAEDADDAEEAPLAALGADGFRSLVADCLEAAGWTTEAVRSGDGTEAPDLRATTPGPVAVTLQVHTVAATEAAVLDAATVEGVAAAAAESGADAAAVASAVPVATAAEDRAAAAGVEVLGPDAIRDALAGTGRTVFPYIRGENV